jgi:3-deoxy-D-manno-octulosonic-acid transferase
MPVFWYQLLVLMILPLYRLRVWLRSRHQVDYAIEVAERFGPIVNMQAQRQQHPVWIHAVSVGETNAAQPIIAHLLAQGWPVLVTNTTRTGQARLRQLFADQVQSVFLPVDSAALMQDFFDVYQPCAIGLIETELWPNLLAQASQRQIPTVLLNARLSARSARGYGKFASLTQPMVQQLSCIAAQDTATAQRFIQLGAQPERVQVTGSLKFDLAPPQAALDLARQLFVDWQLADRPILVAASTHEPEENQLLNIFKAIHTRYPKACLILVPRHPERFDRVATLITDKGWSLAKRSAGQTITPATSVYLADSMGELWTWYALAQMAFVGGSLANTGGHNPLEPARLGVPVVMGRHTFNFEPIVQALLIAGGLIQADDASGVAQTWQAWLSNDGLRVQAGQAGQQVCLDNQGALARQLAVLDQLLSTVQISR